MAKTDPIEDKLRRLTALRQETDPAAVATALGRALDQKSSGLIAAKAADLTAELGQGDLTETAVARLIEKMRSAFDRLMIQPVKRDKGCLGKTAIARALASLDVPAQDLYIAGLRHVQLEPIWGGSVDTAAELRGHCALAMVRTHGPDAVLEVATLLADAERPTRLAAAEALGDSGDKAAEAVLRLKAVTGDEEPEVVGACFQSLLRLNPERSLDFVGQFLGHNEPAVAEAAALALGESRIEAAVPMIHESLEVTVDADIQRVLYLALALSRRENALEILVDEVADGPIGRARGALTALALHRHQQELYRQLESLVEERRDRELGQIWRERFQD